MAVTASEQQRKALRTLAHSRDRGEADRARAILLTLAGWTSQRIAEAFGVREDTGSPVAQRVRPRRHRGLEGDGPSAERTCGSRHPDRPRKVAMIDSRDHVTRQLIVHTSPTKRSTHFITHLEQLDRPYGPKPGTASQACRAGFGQRADPRQQAHSQGARCPKHWLTIEWLPKYAPEFNDIEVVWHDLKAIIWPTRRSPTSTPSTVASTPPCWP
jgi:hypothetical protein